VVQYLSTKPVKLSEQRTPLTMSRTYRDCCHYRLLQTRKGQLLQLSGQNTRAIIPDEGINGHTLMLFHLADIFSTRAYA
jgi:hypothetical protein